MASHVLRKSFLSFSDGAKREAVQWSKFKHCFSPFLLHGAANYTSSWVYLETWLDNWFKWVKIINKIMINHSGLKMLKRIPFLHSFLLQFKLASIFFFCPARLFGFVARKQGSTTDNVSHLFAELDPDQPASAITSFVSKMMKRWSHSVASETFLSYQDSMASFDLVFPVTLFPLFSLCLVGLSWIYRREKVWQVSGSVPQSCGQIKRDADDGTTRAWQGFLH